jgi:predicted lactoylglutathione lyase
MNRINIICLGVRDMAASLAFYKSIGFKTDERADNPPIVFFDTQGSKLELYPLALLAKDIDEDAPPPLSAGGFGGITLAINMKSEREVDDFFALVAKNGGTIAKSPRWLTTWNGYSGYFQDPDGYYWEVAYGPNWKFDGNDMLIVGNDG